MSRKLIYVPIEPLAERYTESWYRNFPVEFTDAGFDVTVIDGVPLEQEVKVGTFLDINSTTHYKWTQLQALSRMFHKGFLKDNDVIFFGDIEFWGLEGVRLLAQMNKVDVKIVGFLHAASYTIEDAFAIAEQYQRYTEVGWIAACDEVYVGSQYHKEAVLARRLYPLGAEHLEERIHVTKNPLFLSDYPLWDQVGEKQKQVVLSNRLDVEKRPNETLKLFNKLYDQFPDWKFVVTSGRSSLRGTDAKAIKNALKMEADGRLTIATGLTKAQYHQILHESRIMVTHSIEENYGYCIAEAILLGCVPLMRQGLSHEEFTDDPDLLFSDEQDAYNKLERLMSRVDKDFQLPYLRVDTNGMDNIIDRVKAL